MPLMNIVQTIFVLFFAMFWGTVGNAWLRWRPFHWPFALHHRRTLLRLATALCLLNLAPVVTAAYVLWLLAPVNQGPTTLLGWLAAVVSGVAPAFSIFGFSRAWAGVMEIAPTCFYFTRAELRGLGYSEGSWEAEIEPSIETLRLDKTLQWGRPDILVGALYVVLGLGLGYAASKLVA